MARLIPLLLVFLLLAGCGRTGDLYLPTEPEADTEPVPENGQQTDEEKDE